MNTDTVDYNRTASEIRGRIVEMSHASRAAHLGSALSCVDILVALYWSILRVDPEAPRAPARDRFIFSKGHAAAALYATLAAKGFCSIERLAQYGAPGDTLAEHPLPDCVSSLEAATGSLGHGLPLGCGMALASKITKTPYRVFVLMSDGECNEGSVWEAAMFAPAKGLDNIAAIVDFNRWQATGRSCDVMALQPLAEKWRAFGWDALEIDGHSIPAIIDALDQLPRTSGKPLAVVCNTVKGKGVSFMEDDNNWHYRIPTEDEVDAAKKELGLI